MERMGREQAIDDLGDSQLDQEAQEQGDVIDAFVSQFEDGSVAGARGRAGGETREGVRRSGPE